MGRRKVWAKVKIEDIEKLIALYEAINQADKVVLLRIIFQDYISEDKISILTETVKQQIRQRNS